MRWQRSPKRAFPRNKSLLIILETQAKSPTFDLLRHGRTQTDGIFRGQIDDPLSDAGRLQMEEAVSDRSWEQIICSPLSRCRYFAEELANKADLNVLVEPAFAEYDFGDWDGKKYEEVMEKESDQVKQFFENPFSCTPPNAEHFSDFHQRVVDAWNVTSQHFSGKSVLIVTHGGVIMSVIAHVLGVDRVHGRIEVDYASFTRIRPGTEGLPDQLISHGSEAN